MRDLEVFDQHTRHWKNIHQLVNEASSDGKIYFHAVQNLTCFKAITLNIARETNNNLVIVAFDSIGYDCFTAIFDKYARRVVPVTSTIPSTSMTAWTSIFRGSQPQVHGIYGTAFYIQEINETVSFLSRQLTAETVIAQRPDFTWLSKAAGSTLFTELAALGYSTRFFGLSNELTALSFFQQVSVGASLVDMPEGEAREFDLDSYAGYLVSSIESSLTQHSADQSPFCSVAFMSCARYAADNGYDQHLVTALAYFAEKLCSMRDQHSNLSILAVSDHGMIRQHPVLSMPLIQDPAVLELSAYKPGGAGRILFFYPKDGSFSALWSLLKTRIGNSGTLFTREQFISKFYSTAVYQPERIGEIVAVADNAQFPSAGVQDAYEHGGLSKEEMMTFVGLI